MLFRSNDTATTEIYTVYNTLSLHDALPISHVHKDEVTGKLHVELEPVWKLTEIPSRIAPGHGACPGCGIFPVLHQMFGVLEGDIVVLFQTGCAMVVTTGYPSTAHRINYIHNLFQNGAATLSGVVEMYH